jgi:hypothetical protein
MARFWVHSSWGARHSLERLEKIAVEEDVIETCTAMLQATGLLTAEVLRWREIVGAVDTPAGLG